MLKEDYSLLHILKFLWGKRKFILLFSVGAAILMALISLVMPNYYTATTTFYAGSPALSNPESIFGNSSSDLYFFGSDSDVDRLLALGKSRELSDYIINKYDLSTHYEIDTSSLKGKEKLYLKFRKQLEITKNKFDALELSFEDKDRTIVAPIANECRAFINKLSRSVIRQNQERMVEVCKNNISTNQQTLNIIEDSIAYLNERFKVIDPVSQGEQISSLLVMTDAEIVEYQTKYDYLKSSRSVSRDSIEIVKATLEGLKKKRENVLTQSLPDFSRSAGKLKGLQQLQNQLSKRIGYDTDRLQQLQSAFNADISALIVIEEAKTPFIKSSPVRSLLVLSAGLAGFIFAILYLLFKRNLKYLREIAA